MIILRYLSREILLTTLAITFVLVVIIMSGDLSRYLWEAMRGKIDPAVLFTLIFFRIPGFLELILPLGFFVGILMVYGRLYAEQEMTVLYACGFSRVKLLALACFSATITALVCGLISLWLTPWGLEQSELIKEQQKSRSDLELVQAGRFQLVNEGNLVTYIESIDEQQSGLQNIFIATVGLQDGEQPIVIRAESAKRIQDTDNDQFYLQLERGIRYEGRPGASKYRVTHFDNFSQHLDQPEAVEISINETEAIPTRTLWQATDIKLVAALQWRLSIPVIVLVMTLFGVSLSHTNPRRGRYAMLFPAIVIYMLYVVVLNAARNAIEEGSLPTMPGLWLIHTLFLLLAFTVFVARGGISLRTFFSAQKASVKNEGLA